MSRIYPFRYFSQKVLPLAYDDSLSYYEVVAKLTAKVNEIIGAVNENLDDIVREYLDQVFIDVTFDAERNTIVLISGDDVNPFTSGDVYNFQIGDKMYNIVDEVGRTLLADLEGRISKAEERLNHVELNTYRTVQFFVGRSGSDDNDGRSREHPFRTLDRAFKEWNKYSSIWIYIWESGIYEARDIGIYANRNLHVYAEVDNVILRFIDPADGEGGIPIYCAHWVLQTRDKGSAPALIPMRIQCYESDGVTEGHLYFDGGMINLMRVQFDQYVSINGGALNADTCIFRRLRAHTSNLLIGTAGGETETRFTNDNSAQTALQCWYSNTHITGYFHTNNLPTQGSAETNNAVDVIGGQIYIGSLVLDDNVNKYYYGIRGRQGADIRISTDRLTTIANRALHGNSFDASCTVNTY